MRALTAFVVYAVVTHAATAQTTGSVIPNMELFIDQCPQNDPAYATIRADFKIRRDGVLASEVACMEPYTKLPLSQYTDELLILQALRLIYYQDLGRSNYLPWTPLRMYDWMKSKIAGFNVDTQSQFSYCCGNFDGGLYVGYGVTTTDNNRQYHLSLNGVIQNAALFGHETRHVDGFPHVSCCGVPNGCDQTYDVNNLSPYGIQYYLNLQWFTGDINLGYSCLDTPVAYDAGLFINSSAAGFAGRFCDMRPPVLDMIPKPGGTCNPGRYPHVNADGVVSSGGFRQVAVAPGSLIALFGLNLAASRASAQSVPLPVTLGGATLEINGTPAPLIFTDPQQVNAQLPFEAPPGTATARVNVPNYNGFTFSFTVAPIQLGIFTDSNDHAIAQNKDYSLNSPTNPAKPGDYVTLYLTGQGLVDPPVATGAASLLSPLSKPAQTATAQIGDLGAKVLFLGMTPGLVGLCQASLVVPVGLSAGDYRVEISLGGTVSNPALISIAAQ